MDVIDFVGGYEDIQNRLLKSIGESSKRFREDPVRIIRAIRFKSKLDLTFEPKLEKEILKLSHLLNEISSGRIYEETLKMFLTGNAESIMQDMQKYQIIEYILPITQGYLNAKKDRRFIFNALRNTDKRFHEDKTLTPSFLFSVFLWPALINKVGELNSKKIKVTKITRAAEKLEAEVERQPKGDEIGAQLEMSGDEVLMAMQYSRRHSSLNSPFQEGENSSLLDIIEDSEAEEPEAKIMMESMSEEVNGALETLSERERVVLEMYFGINRDSAMTLNEIGEEFDLTRERVRQIKEKAIQRLRHRSRSKNLRRYLG